MDEFNEIVINTDMEYSEADGSESELLIGENEKKEFNGVAIGLKNTKSQRKCKGLAGEWSMIRCSNIFSVLCSAFFE
jgi:hypothetical protein